MQKRELVHIEKRFIKTSAGIHVRYSLMFDGLPITSFNEDELYRARFAACNLLFAIFRDIVESDEIKVYDR